MRGASAGRCNDFCRRHAKHDLLGRCAALFFEFENGTAFDVALFRQFSGWEMINKRTGLAAFAVLAASTPGHATVTISSAATQNMSCSTGTCVPTAPKAVLNAGDLETLLAAGGVSVVTTNGSVQANNIAITAAFSWSAPNSLTLDAYQSITFSAVVRNLSTGNVALVTNDGGPGGALTFTIGSGRLDTNAVSIGGVKYKMASSVKELAQKIVSDTHGNYALSHNYDARGDGVYYAPPIPALFGGRLIGLGHNISNLVIADTANDSTGLFMYLKKNASVIGIALRNVVVGGPNIAGGIAGENDGTISNSSVSGNVHCRGGVAGGLVGMNDGTITTSQSSASVGASYAGGLIGLNGGKVSLSFATGTVKARTNGTAGGLVGLYGGSVEDSYAEGQVIGSRKSGVAGFIGDDANARIATSYSTGAGGGKHAQVGGFTCTEPGGASYKHSYWDTTTSGTDQASCSSSVSGITGLTTEQLQSGLPQGFSNKIWAEDLNINGGFPYLIGNPPPK